MTALSAAQKVKYLPPRLINSQIDWNFENYLIEIM